MIVETFKKRESQETMASILVQIKLHRKSTKKTLLITDERCLEHAAFDSYHNISRRQKQKDD